MRRKANKLALRDLRLALLLVIPVSLVSSYIVSTLNIYAKNTHFQQLEYTFKTKDCKISSNYCVLKVTVKNPTNKVIEPQYVDTGGGPVAEVNYNARLYDIHSKSCAAHLFNGVPLGVSSINPEEKIRGEVHCLNNGSDGMDKADHIIIYGKKYMF